MNKIGSNHSQLLQAMVEIANKEVPAPAKPTFSETIFDTLKPKKQPTIAQIVRSVTKQAQLSDGIGGDDFDLSAGSPESLSTEGLGGPEEAPMDEAGTAPDDGKETAKKALADALIALCGGPEEAKACLESLSTTPDPATDGGAELGGDPLADPTGAPGGEMGEVPGEPAPMASPMPMQDAAPMPMPY